MMSKLWWILLGIVLSIILLSIAFGQIMHWIDIAESDVTPLNKNLQFIGNDTASYGYGKSMINADGTMLVVSTLESGSWLFSAKHYISLIKLDTNAQPLWEKKVLFHKASWKDYVPFLTREFNPPQTLMVRELTKSGTQYKLLLTRSTNPTTEVFILSFDEQGELLDSKPVKIEIAWHTQMRAVCVKNWIYICYIDKVDKLLCLAKTDLQSGRVLYNAMKSFKSENLVIHAIAPDSTGEEISIAAYDRKVGTSFFRYDRLNDLKEYFRTDPKTEIFTLQNIDGRILGGIKDDTLLVVSDITNMSKPLLKVSYKPAFGVFTPIGVQVINGNYYVCVSFANPDPADWKRDVMVLAFNDHNEKTGEFLIQGKRIENGYQLLTAPDKQLYAFGNSLSIRLGKAYQVFVSKVKL